MGTLKVKNYISQNGSPPVPIETLEPATKKKIGMALNTTALKTIDYIPNQKEQ